MTYTYFMLQWQCKGMLMDFERNGFKPLYQQLADRLKNDMESGIIPENSKLPPEEQMALNLNVSRPTIRSTLKKLESEGYIFRVRGKGTFSAPRKSRRRRLIIVEEFDPMRDRNQNLHSMVAGIAAYTQGQDTSLVFVARKNLRDYVGELRNNENFQSGIIFLHLSGPDYKFDEKMIADVEKADIPWLCSGGEHYPNGSYVDIDNEKAMIKIIDHLLDLDHRHFSIISFANSHSHHFASRCDSCVRRLRERCIPINEKNIHYIGNWIGNSAIQEIEMICRNIIISKTLPTAIVCTDDFIAIHTIKYLEKSGLSVPRDISITGFNNNYDYSTIFSPRLTTINLDYFELGYKSASALFAMMDDYQKIKLLLPLEMHLGDSSALANR